MKKYSLIVFFVAGVGNVLSQVVSVAGLEVATKPLLVVSLAVYYWFAADRDKRTNTVLLALLFSWLGDVFLLLQSLDELFFMVGLGSFLVAHIFYIRCYQQFQAEDTSRALTGVQRFRFSIPIILAGTGLITVLYPHLGALKIPVIVYALVLMLMALNALFRFGRTNSSSFTAVFLGAILFMISDSLIAINKFLTPVSEGGFWIMLTYIAAQFLLVTGLLRHEK
jgi:uncharacterized membrane protein YhhN